MCRVVWGNWWFGLEERAEKWAENGQKDRVRCMSIGPGAGWWDGGVSQMRENILSLDSLGVEGWGEEDRRDTQSECRSCVAGNVGAKKWVCGREGEVDGGQRFH